MGTGSLPEVKRLGRDVDHSPSSIAKFKVRVEVHLYSSSVSFWPVIGWRAKRPGSGVDNPPSFSADVNPLNAELNPICHLLALLGAHHILHVSRIRVKERVDLYLYSPCGPSWLVLRLTLPFYLYILANSCKQNYYVFSIITLICVWGNRENLLICQTTFSSVLYSYRKISPRGSFAVSKVTYWYQCLWGLRSSPMLHSVD